MADMGIIKRPNTMIGKTDAGEGYKVLDKECVPPKRMNVQKSTPTRSMCQIFHEDGPRLLRFPGKKK